MVIKMKKKPIESKIKKIGFVSIILGVVTLFSMKFELIDKDVFHDIGLFFIIGGIIFIDPFYTIYKKLYKSKK